MSFEPTAPPPAPDLSGTGEVLGLADTPCSIRTAAVVLIASCSAATSGGNDTPTDGATSAQAPEP